METLMMLVKIFGISFTSGINLYATVAMVGIAIRFNLISNLPYQLDVLANEYVIGIALVLYICEFVADKIPAFDSVWDSVHTFIRPFAAAMLALMASGDSPMIIKVIAVLLAGSVALTSHTTKAGIRLVANTSPEPFSNTILSIAEDIGVAALVILILTHPVIAAVIIACILAVIFWQGPKLIAFIIFMFKAISLRISSFIPSKKHINVEMMSLNFDKKLNAILFEGEKVYLTIEAAIKGDKKATGYIIVSSNRIIMLYKKFFGIRFVEYDLPEIKRMTFNEGFLVDKITFSYDDKQILLTLFKSSCRNLSDVKTVFKSFDVDIVEPVPEMSLSKAGI